MEDEPIDDPLNLLSFRPVDEPAGLTIVDNVERRRCTLETSEAVDPHEAPKDEFYFPVDRGVSISTEEILLSHTVAVYIRNHAGIMVNEIGEEGKGEFPKDRYSLQITAPIKLYLVFESAFTVEVTRDKILIEFSTKKDVFVGARSHHDSPAGVITTTDNPADMMNALSYFGSALKTTTVERSYPSLRGHPPAIEVGKELRVPPVLEKPDTGVRIIVPPEYRSIFPVASLAYYLAASVEPGSPARLETDEGLFHEFSHDKRGFCKEVERIQKQVFFLDCVTRTEGFYPINLHERRQIEREIDLDFSELYDLSLPAQLRAYLNIPFEKVEPQIPRWKLVAHSSVEAKHFETLPFVVNDLAIIRPVREQSVIDTKSPIPPESRSGGNFHRSTARSDLESAPTPTLVELDNEDSLEQTWIGPGAPLGASKAMIAAYQNQIDRTPTSDNIDITVVCNDIEMGDERDIVDEVYGSRDELPFNVSVHREVTTNELSHILNTEIDFLHYIGHIDGQGFECIDGKFDVADLNQSGIDAFFLNACTSYQQGVKLIEKGGIAGIVTLKDVINSGAERIGKTLAKLLNQGFPLRAALDLAKTQSIMGGHYVLLGDGNLDIAQSEIGNPILIDVTKSGEKPGTEDDLYKVDLITYPTKRWNIGSTTLPLLAGMDQHFLVPRKMGQFELSRKSLLDYIEKGNSPIRYKHNILWKEDLSI